MGERRKAARQKSFLRGCIYFNNRRSAVDCLVRDISPTGARLIISDSITTPDVVELYIPQKQQTLRAHIHWRPGSELGVAFGATAEPADAGNQELAQRVQKLEAEIAALKRVLKKIKSEIETDADAA